MSPEDALIATTERILQAEDPAERYAALDSLWELVGYHLPPLRPPGDPRNLARFVLVLDALERYPDRVGLPST